VDSILKHEEQSFNTMKIKKSIMKYWRSIILLFILLLSFACVNQTSDLASISLEKCLRSGRPTLAEFGWRECIPCKAMRPILEDIAIEYKESVNILIVEIPYHEDLAEKYGIMVMPVQIFFDSTGQEIFRHAGFLPKEEIITQFESMGVSKQ
jgi:thioredoxin 1